MVKDVLTVVGSAVVGGVACNKGYNVIKKYVTGLDKKKATALGAVLFAGVAALVLFLYNEFVLDPEDYNETTDEKDDDFIDLDMEMED